jgi:DNA processing protein
MGWETSQEHKKPKQRELFIELSEEETKIVDILKKEENMGIDTLCLKASMPMSKVSPVLLSLEFGGIVKSLPGKRYALV